MATINPSNPPPIPQNPIGENLPWRTWLNNLATKVYNTAYSVAGISTSVPPANGDILIGNTTTETYVPNTITAGANISIVNGPGTITINASTSDPWEYVELTTDFSTTSTTPVNVTGLEFAPSASSKYIVEGFFLVQSSATSVGVDPGVSWPSGLLDGAAKLESVNSSTTTVISNLNYSSGGAVNSTGVPIANTSYPATLSATFLTSSSPSGTFQITLQAE